MKDLIKDYLEMGLSRRQLMTGLSAVGLSTIAAESVAQSLAPFAAQAAAPMGPMREITATGGGLFVAQLKAAGVEYIFFNPSTGDSPIFDALVDEPGIHLIKGVQEGAVAAMADGYARASGKPGVIVVANIGLPNAMTQMLNSSKDQIPLIVVVASVDQAAQGRENYQEPEHAEMMTQPLTKWYWQAQSAATVPDTVRRAIKYATTHPSGPVFLAFPGNTLRDTAKSAIWDQAKFDVPMHIRPGKAEIEMVARLLIEAKNPMLNIGDEVTACRAEAEVLALAELLGYAIISVPCNDFFVLD